jgi:hypothetical protein
MFALGNVRSKKITLESFKTLPPFCGEIKMVFTSRIRRMEIWQNQLVHQLEKHRDKETVEKIHINV